MSGTLIAALAMLGTMVLTSLYGLAAAALRKRVTIRSPEARAIEEIAPAVNALMASQPAMMQGIIAILEAQKGQCNGNVDRALEVNRAAHARFNEFLISSARVGS